MCIIKQYDGGVVELVDTADLKSSGPIARAGSSPALATINSGTVEILGWQSSSGGR